MKNTLKKSKQGEDPRARERERERGNVKKGSKWRQEKSIFVHPLVLLLRRYFDIVSVRLVSICLLCCTCTWVGVGALEKKG